MGRKILFLAFSGIIAATILAVFLLVVLPDRVFQEEELADVPNTIEEPLITFIDPIRGAETAEVTIVEYGDFSCALCQNLEPDLRALIAESPKKRRLVWKDAPNVAIHPEAFTLAMAARCAQDQGKFWEFHDHLLGSPSNPNASQLRTIAENLELDGEIFTSCMASDVMRPIVQHTFDEALALNVTSTPTLYINGELYQGPLSLSDLRSAVEAL